MGQLGQPAWQHAMLTKSLDASKLMFILRSSDTTNSQTSLNMATKVLKRALSDILGIGTVGETTWLNAQLPISLGGMGIKDPTIIAGPARLAGILSYLKLAPKLGFGNNLLQYPPEFTSVCSKIQKWTGTSFTPLDSWTQKHHT